jgi:hypothetical protein
VGPGVAMSGRANRRPMSVSQRSSWASALFLLLPLFSLLGCGAQCYGDDCGCEGERECIISCAGSGCDLSCARAADSCGAICGDDCRFECHDTDHCSSFSGDDSRIECYQMPSCASECGAGCQYSAHNVTSLDLTVGPDSVVDCSQMSSCEVTCEGECEVTCSEVSSCDVHCKKGTSLENSGKTRICR